MATVAEINASIGVNTANNPTSGQSVDQRTKQQALGQDEFFKLLTTQLASQDPLKPMEDTAFIAQMAQFSALEMQSKLNTNFDKFTQGQVFSSAQNMIGREVSLFNNGQIVTGRAQSIEADGGITRVFVDGVGYNVDGVFKISEILSPPAATTSKQVQSSTGN